MSIRGRCIVTWTSVQRNPRHGNGPKFRIICSTCCRRTCSSLRLSTANARDRRFTTFGGEDGESLSSRAAACTCGLRFMASCRFLQHNTHCGPNCAATPNDMETWRCTRLLEKADPAYAAACHVRDRVRVVRALEVTYLTGVPFSRHRSRHLASKSFFPYVGIGLTRHRADLYDRIGKRTDTMFGSGWLAEVQTLLAQGYTEGCAAMNGLGYRELLGYLAGRKGWQETVDAIKQATRRLAKRQLTWFCKMQDLAWYNLSAAEETVVVAEILSRLRSRPYFQKRDPVRVMPGKPDSR